MILAHRQEDQWIRTELPDINPCSYSQLIYKEPKTGKAEKIPSSTNAAEITGYPHVED
jgi:hypothetical protein